MTNKLLVPSIVALALAMTVPAFAQNRFADEARERAERRAENQAMRDAETAPPVRGTVTDSTPATPAAAPAAPADPAAPAQPAATPAPAPAQ